MKFESEDIVFTPITSLLSQVIDNRGRTCPTAEKGIPLIATNCIGNENLYPVKKNIRHVSLETYNTWFRGHPEPGDVIFVNKGTPGRVCLVPDPVDFCIAQDMVSLRVNEHINNLYLLAAIRAPQVQNQIQQMQVGTMIPHFKKGDFEKLLIPMRDMPTQKAIGKIYFELSQKIDVNDRISRTLEDIAQTIFKSWFIDFDPVKAKMAREKPAGMDAVTAALFPDAMEESELGLIPKGWEIAPIGEVLLVGGGTTPSTTNAEYWDGEHCWTTPKDLSSQRGLITTSSMRKISDLGLAQISSGLLPVNSVLMSCRAPIGYVSINAVPTAVNQGFITLKNSAEYHSIYLLNWINANIQEIHNRAGGATFAEITRKAFREIPFLKPSPLVVKLYSEIVEPIVLELEQLTRQIENLQVARDLLLPRLVSGELQIPEEMWAS